MSHFSLKDNVTGNDTSPGMTCTHARSFLGERRRLEESAVFPVALTLYEDAHIPAAEVDVVGHLAPVNARVVPLERPQEDQGAVHHLHPLGHFAVQPERRKDTQRA